MTEHRHFLSAGGMVFALYVSRTGNLNGQPAQAVRYFHQDHLGSTSAVTDDTGAVVERMAYDPWGKRRNTNGVADPMGLLVGVTTDRGYTLHEHLDEVGAINMNGRLFDPLIGRFMSADPFIQDPMDLQSYNRYAYVRNNPMLYTDPSGYSWWTSIRSVVVRVVAAVADASGCSGYCSATVGAYYGQKNGGGLGGAVVGGVVGYVGYQVSVNYPLTDTSGEIIWSNVGSAVAINGVSGCASAAASGRNCVQAAAAAAAGTYGAAYGPLGSLVAGCANGAAFGSSCKQGVVDTLKSVAVNYLARELAAPIGRMVDEFRYRDSDFIEAEKIKYDGEKIANAGAFAGGVALTLGVGAASNANPLSTISARINGNSWLSPDETSLYQIVSINDNNDILKYGITNKVGHEVGRYTDRELANMGGRMQVIATFSNRAQARIAELMFCGAYVAVHNALPRASSRC